ncbi:methyl-accepting chemotaxis protein [Cellulosilyticum sp. I15G10I2]|uniref:methyl-accepting chemotaxis protein n=1 Tax=Cellulosilyticum sp. I15G10I2 TaxID=1892843 RepID=UPI00085C0C94|nr:methyl-accepting chemotaxis protein [Cellulosilyticum sp. I15G10I2]
MNRFKTGNIKLKSKLMSMFILSGLIPMMIISVFNLIVSNNNLRDLEESLIKEKLIGDIHSAKIYLDKYYGNLEFKDEVLIDKSGNSIKEHYEMVDTLTEDLNVSATLFAKDGDDFIRISTNILTADGNRAIGTYLGKESSAYANIINGERYIGTAQILGNAYITAYEPLKDENQEVIGILFIGISKQASEQLIAEQVRKGTTVTIGIMLIFALAGVVTAWILAHSIAKSIRHVIGHAQEIANYNIATDIDEAFINRKDEVGDLAKAIHTIEESLRYMIGQVNDASLQVSASSEELNSMASQTATTTDEVAKTICDIAEGATDQAQSTAQGLLKLSELEKYIKEDQIHMKELNEVSHKVEALVNSGLEVINTLFKKTDESMTATTNVYDTILKTNESSSKISAASNVITSISQQTNLLALNASIEAARAGEHGRGFAVVAEEIRKLAEQSASSSKMIDEMVENLQHDSERAVNTTEVVKATLEEQVSHMNITKEKYLEISEAINHQGQVVELLNESGHVMAIKNNEVYATLDALSAVAEQNAAATEESSACIEEQAASIHEIVSSSKSLAELAQVLHHLITRFKV